MAWVLLFIAGVLEAVWALALKRSEGFTRFGATLLFVVAGLASIVLLALALRDLPVGTGLRGLDRSRSCWSGNCRHRPSR